MEEKFLTCGDVENTGIFESKEIEKAWAILFADKTRTYSIVLVEEGVCDKTLCSVLCAMGANAVVQCVDAQSALERYVEFASESSVNGVLLKEYYREKTGKTPRVISVEKEKTASSFEGVDVVITVAELALMVKEVEEVGVSLSTFAEREFDVPLQGDIATCLEKWIAKKQAGFIEVETEVEQVELSEFGEVVETSEAGEAVESLPEITSIILNVPEKEKEKVQPYSTRISQKDRRKMKRQNKKK